jgi:hypothetical protein
MKSSKQIRAAVRVFEYWSSSIPIYMLNYVHNIDEVTVLLFHFANCFVIISWSSFLIEANLIPSRHKVQHSTCPAFQSQLPSCRDGYLVMAWRSHSINILRITRVKLTSFQFSLDLSDSRQGQTCKGVKMFLAPSL